MKKEMMNKSFNVLNDYSQLISEGRNKALLLSRISKNHELSDLIFVHKNIFNDIKRLERVIDNEKTFDNDGNYIDEIHENYVKSKQKLENIEKEISMIDENYLDVYRELKEQKKQINEKLDEFIAIISKDPVYNIIHSMATYSNDSLNKLIMKDMTIFPSFFEESEKKKIKYIIPVVFYELYADINQDTSKLA